MRNSKAQKKISIGQIVKIIIFVIAIPLLFFAVDIMYKSVKYPDKVPDVFGIKPMIVLTGSMEAEIYAGDLALVKEVDPSTLKENDIIAFRNEENKVTTHRIVEIVSEGTETLFRTKGDNNNVEDSNLVKTTSVEGIFVARIPKIGSFLMFMQQPIGLAVVLLVILVVGLGVLYFMNKSDAKKTNEDEEYRREFEEFKKKKQQEENANK